MTGSSANGSLKAKEVDVETATGVASAPVWVRGSVISVTPDVLMVKNDASGQELTMRLLPTTGYEKYSQPAAAGDFRPGQLVRVKYRVERASARRIVTVTASASIAVLRNGRKAQVEALAARAVRKQ